MSLALWVIISVIVYIITFRDDFEKEYIDKVLALAVILGLIVFILGCLTSL